jgi:hypothetical protein
MILQLAREHNDPRLVAAVEKLGRDLRDGPPADADQRLREMEEKVGIDPGGWSMAGQPLFRPTPEMKARLQSSGERLAAAMRAEDAAAVRAVVAEMTQVLGDQAGVPDGRRAGVRPAPLQMTAAQATALFVEALRAEGRAVRQVASGKPLPDQMVRLYADVLLAAVRIRPWVQEHAAADLEELDKLAHGAAAILMSLQQPQGHFPFPDLRGKNIRFGAMTEKQLQRGAVEIRDGWIITADPDGGTQFDTGLCGAALLEAATVHNRSEWRAAALRAADWALAQPCCANFNYNAFSVSLLSRAFAATGEEKYLQGALKKFRVGVAPGQAANGRWLDPHNARTVYHVILLRALADLAAVLPAERTGERAEVLAVLRPGLDALLREFDSMGITVEALPELLAAQKLLPDETRLPAAIAAMAAHISAKCTDGQRVKMGAQPHQLATVPEACAQAAKP